MQEFKHAILTISPESSITSSVFQFIEVESRRKSGHSPYYQSVYLRQQKKSFVVHRAIIIGHGRICLTPF
jgi:hypothetical protein